MRRYHILTTNKAQSLPQNILFFDVETVNKKLTATESRPTLSMGWAAFLRRKYKHHTCETYWKYFEDSCTFWTFVEDCIRPKTKLYLVAHNVGFDFRVLGGFQHAKEAGWSLESFYVKGLTTLLRFKVGKSTVQVMDNTNLFPTSLQQLGKQLNFPKLEIDFKTATREELKKYCKRDVEIMIQAWQHWLEFIQHHKLGNFRVTVPSQAFTAYRHRFMKYPIHIHNNERALRLERESYHGGRVEVFRKGEFRGGEFFQLDVNSMYGYIMKEHKFPTQLYGYRKSYTLAALEHKLKHQAVIARVTVTTQEAAYPYKLDKRLIYPVGNFQTVLTTPELLYALQNQHIQEVHEIVYYRQEKIFADYVNYFHKLKCDYEISRNRPMRYIAKLFINSLYGKFGQRGLKQTVLGESAGDKVERLRVFNRDTMKESVIYYIAGKIIEHVKHGESYNSFPAICAHVTAYARLYLWELIKRSGRENVFYCDTDGLIVNKRGYENLKELLHDTKLGYLKVEAYGNTLVIHAPKDYRIGDKTRIKGVRANAVRVHENVYRQQQFMGLRGMVQSGIPDWITIKEVEKRLSRQIKTGVLHPDGWVTPFHLPL